ncbi:uncharacterized protein LOC117290222 [Asterias rubens]|uniref:uncharacterized protein LOC117290222 n=1 Tax=Asterias rubens TaxID=7604 RepID=UPI0014554FB6|nr:uncharacterized protein LOC117290222 [Asterias rubens]
MFKQEIFKYTDFGQQSKKLSEYSSETVQAGMERSGCMRLRPTIKKTIRVFIRNCSSWYGKIWLYESGFSRWLTIMRVVSKTLSDTMMPFSLSALHPLANRSSL